MKLEDGLQKTPFKIILEIAELWCHVAYGFDGPETFPDCGECVVCLSRKIVKQKKGKKTN